MPRLSSRKIPIYHKPPYVSQEEIERTVDYYKRGIAMHDMIRRMQYARDERDGKCLSYIDLYTILYQALKEKRLLQRENPPGEMYLEDFRMFFQKFQQGGTERDCWEALNDLAKQRTSLDFAKKIFRTMSNRWRDEKNANFQRIEANITEKHQQAALIDFFAKLRRTKLPFQKPGGAVENRDAVILYLHDLPVGYMEHLKTVQTDICKKLLAVLDPTLLNAEQASRPPLQDMTAEERKVVQQELINSGSRALDVEPPVELITPETTKEDQDELDELLALNSTYSEKNPAQGLPLDPKELAATLAQDPYDNPMS